MTSLPLWFLADPVTAATKAADFRVSLEDMVSGTGRLTDGDFANYEADGTAFDTGDVLFGRLRPYLAKSWRAGRPGTAGGDIIVMRPTSRVTSEFLGWVVQSEPFVRRASAETRGVKMPRTAWEYLAPVPVWTPSIDQQRRIADYLDAETAQIDGMMAELDELERRLNVRWRARLESALWGASVESRALGWDLTLVTSGSRGWGAYYADAGERFLRITDLTRGSIAVSDRAPQYVDLPPNAEGSRTRTRAGDLLFSITAYLGSVAVVDPQHVGAYTSQHVALARLNGEHWLPEFVAYAVLADSGQSFLKSRGTGAAKDGLDLDDIRAIPVPAVPVEHQTALVRELDSEYAQHGSMLADIARLRDLLIERRSALVTAVITGTKEIA